ncbi:cell division protein ZipA [Marinobacterium sediminicola]|uniref:Cell division protein ZipA n=1 Tax=Marinobacterium sediminicola TaxID=518898 RepID=A0ABY1RYG0_9GAMM|nr:cell division protein ZipA [Marinobacterium sediminicola]ULG68737.1 cell division protein ZipA [Marinobacterium sediminicola]SMR73263.1 cell division protein ZipA [Marinobacterium sediminicola]
MDISLREWLIIGGVLIVILILVDGWRRVSANRSRLRLEIDRTLSELAEDDPHNPELPNGGARVRDPQGQTRAETQRVEPGFADDQFTASPTPEPSLKEMDPLFDDIPSGVVPSRSEAKPVKSRKKIDVSSSEAAAQEELELTLPADPVSPELKPLDLDQPIPVLFDEINPRDNPELPDDTLAAYRQSIDDAEQQASQEEPISRADTAPELPTEDSAEIAIEVAATETNVTSDEVSESPKNESTDKARSARGLKSLPDPEHVLIITVVGRNGKHLPGPALDKIVTACGMEWGDMSIYHRPEDSNPDAPIQFSMANAVAPGTFDPDNLEALETPAVTFFLSLNEPSDAMTAYECMLATAETLAKHLDGDLLDEDRSVMRPQTKEHYRERIRDFEMHRRQRRAN